MADLDEISMMLGEIKSDLRYALKWFDEHEARDQDRYDKLAAQIAVTAAFAPRMDRVEVDIAASKPVIESIKKMKWVAAGFVGAIALAGGVVGGVATSVLKWFA